MTLGTKSVLISGASSGIGEASAFALAKHGFKVYAGVRKTADGDKFSSNDNITAVILDIAKPQSITETLEHISKDSPGGLYALINNAGVSYGGPFECLPLAQIEQTIDVNVKGTLVLTHAALPLLRKAQGRIVSISSMFGLVAGYYAVPYSASKFAIEGFTDALRQELKVFNVAVCAIEPGYIKTPMLNKLTKQAEILRESSSADDYKAMIDETAKVVENPKASDVEKVVAKILDALCSAKPKRRYRVGDDAKFLFLLSLFPSFIKDYVMRKIG